MKVFWTGKSELHMPAAYFADGRMRPCAEVPQRAVLIREALVAAGAEVHCADHVDETDIMAAIAAVHDGAYLEYLRTIHARWTHEYGDGDVLPDTFPMNRARRQAKPPESAAGQVGFYCFDMAAPIARGTWAAAVGSAGCAIHAADCLLAGERAVYALCRPPGHHAGRDTCGGFCYLNNAAIAAQRLLNGLKKSGKPQRVAILDVDYHHGNGTQELFYERGDVLFVSLHAEPGRQYPYYWGFSDERGHAAGAGCNVNFPLPRKTAEIEWLAALDAACGAVERFAAQALVVSLGVDIYMHDDVGDFGVSLPGFAQLGRRLAKVGLPTVMVQEGGYRLEAVGPCVAEVLKGFEAGQS